MVLALMIVEDSAQGSSVASASDVAAVAFGEAVV
jgi:hypothetical protein